MRLATFISKTPILIEYSLAAFEVRRNEGDTLVSMSGSVQILVPPQGNLWTEGADSVHQLHDFGVIAGDDSGRVEQQVTWTKLQQRACILRSHGKRCPGFSLEAISMSQLS